MSTKPDYDNLTTWDFWTLEDKLLSILYNKGYTRVNCCITWNRDFVLLPCLEVPTYDVEDLVAQITRFGYTVDVMKKRGKPSFSNIFIKDTYPVELLEVVEDFEVRQ